MAKPRASKATPARLLALKLAREVRERDAYLRELVSVERAATQLPAEEFDFAQVLAFGVTMCRGTLDEAIDRALSSPRDVRPKVRDALRISAYEMLFLHKPDHVVVDQGVELVRSVTPRAATFPGVMSPRTMPPGRVPSACPNGSPCAWLSNTAAMLPRR